VGGAHQSRDGLHIDHFSEGLAIKDLDVVPASRGDDLLHDQRLGTRG
jgi:hypothetical protein